MKVFSLLFVLLLFNGCDADSTTVNPQLTQRETVGLGEGAWAKVEY